MDLAAALRAEMESLQKELVSDPRFLKWRDLRNALAHFEPPSANPMLEGLAVSAGRSAERPYVKSLRMLPNPDPRKQGFVSARQRALNQAEEYLRDKNELVPIAEIYDYLVSLGTTLGGQNPRGNLSALMYKDSRFRSYGRAGWVLSKNDASRDEPQQEAEENEPNDVQPSSGSDAGSADIFS